MPEPLPDEPPKRFTQLPPATRRFILSLGEDDLKTLVEVIRLFSTVRGWCRVNRWLAYGVLGLLIVMWQGFDAIRHGVETLLSASGKR